MVNELALLLQEGVIDEVIGGLKTGKEAEVCLVRHQGEVIAAKIYKERHARSFHHNAEYKEGRLVRNTRTQRAMDRGSKFGQAAAEEAWKSAEADALYKLHAAGVRVPAPVMFYEGVLLMQLVVDAEGRPAPRLIDAHPTREAAGELYRDLRRQVTTMLCGDLIHGDLSAYNVLLGADGPTIIDFPQIISAAANSRAEFFFRRDLENLRLHLAAIDPELSSSRGDAAEIWRGFVRRDLSPDFVPSGRPPPEHEVRHGSRGGRGGQQRGARGGQPDGQQRGFHDRGGQAGGGAHSGQPRHPPHDAHGMGGGQSGERGQSARSGHGSGGGHSGQVRRGGGERSGQPGQGGHRGGGERSAQPGHGGHRGGGGHPGQSRHDGQRGGGELSGQPGDGGRRTGGGHPGQPRHGGQRGGGEHAGQPRHSAHEGHGAGGQQADHPRLSPHGGRGGGGQHSGQAHHSMPGGHPPGQQHRGGAQPPGGPHGAGDRGGRHRRGGHGPEVSYVGQAAPAQQSSGGHRQGAPERPAEPPPSPPGHEPG